MKRIITSIAAAALIAAGTTAVSTDTTLTSALHDYRVVTVVDALVQPWSIAFLPGGDMLITERPGRLRIVRNGKLLPQPVEGVPQVSDLAGRIARGDAASELRVEPAALSHLLEGRRDGSPGDHGARARPLRERSPHQRAAAVPGGRGRPESLQRQDRVRQERLSVPVARRSADATRGQTRGASGAGLCPTTTARSSGCMTMAACRRTTRSSTRRERSRRSGATGTATCRDCSCIQTPASYGPMSTGRRAATSSIAFRPGATTAGRSSASA